MASSAGHFPASLLRGAVRAGVDACVYLPDSCLTSVIRAFQSSAKITMIPCAREDEGVAIAVGLELGGRSAVCLMEASGIGYSALILARAQVQRTPVVIVASHTGGAGEPASGMTCAPSGRAPPLLKSLSGGRDQNSVLEGRPFCSATFGSWNT